MVDATGCDLGAQDPTTRRSAPGAGSALTPAAPAPGRRSANTAATTSIASSAMALAKAVNAGSGLALDADQPTAQDQRRRNHHTQRPAGHKSLARSRT